MKKNKDDDKKKGIVDMETVTTTAKERMERDLEVSATCVEGTLPEAIRVDNKYYFEGAAVIPEEEAEAIMAAVEEEEPPPPPEGGEGEGGVTARKAKEQEEQDRKGR